MNAMAKLRRATPAPVPADLRRRLEAAIDRLIAAVDALDEPGMDLEDGHDAEEEFDEPSLGATEALDQRAAWREGGAVLDGEATGTEDDLAVFLSDAGREAGQRATAAACARVREIGRRRQPRAEVAGPHASPTADEGAIG